MEDFEAASPVAVKVQHNLKTKIGQVVALTETETESTNLWLDKNAHPEPIAETYSCEDNLLHDMPESGVLPKKGLLSIKSSYGTLHFLRKIYRSNSYIKALLSYNS